MQTKQAAMKLTINISTSTRAALTIIGQVIANQRPDLNEKLSDDRLVAACICAMDFLIHHPEQGVEKIIALALTYGLVVDETD